MPLADEEQQHLTAAEGYLDLGMPLEANAELELIDPFCRHLPEVLCVRVEIYSRLETWELMQTVAKRLVDYDPDNIQWIVWLAFATRRAVSIESAKAIRRHSDSPTGSMYCAQPTLQTERARSCVNLGASAMPE